MEGTFGLTASEDTRILHCSDGLSLSLSRGVIEPRGMRQCERVLRDKVITKGGSEQQSGISDADKTYSYQVTAQKIKV